MTPHSSYYMWVGRKATNLVARWGGNKQQVNCNWERAFRFQQFLSANNMQKRRVKLRFVFWFFTVFVF